MPYITPERQVSVSISTNKGHRIVAMNPGQLNYIFTEVVQEYLHGNGLCYQTINDIIGALEQAKDEFRRRVVHHYEDRKIEENGDVYDSRYTGGEK